MLLHKVVAFLLECTARRSLFSTDSSVVTFFSCGEFCAHLYLGAASDYLNVHISNFNKTQFAYREYHGIPTGTSQSLVALQ
jgi:hypothetical protein